MPQIEWRGAGAGLPADVRYSAVSVPSANFPFCHSIVRVGRHLSLSFPRLAVSPDGARAAMQGAGRTVMPAGRLAEQSSLAQATPARRKNQANRVSGLGCLVIQDSSLQVSDPCRGIFVVTGQCPMAGGPVVIRCGLFALCALQPAWGRSGTSARSCRDGYCELSSRVART